MRNKEEIKIRSIELLKLRRVRICSTKDKSECLRKSKFKPKILDKYRYLSRIKRILEINLNFCFDFVFCIERTSRVVVVVFSF